MGRKAEGEGEGGGVKGLREEENGRSLGSGTAEGKMRRWEIGDQAGCSGFQVTGMIKGFFWV